MVDIQQGAVGAGNTPVSILGNSIVGSGSQTVTTAGTRVQLSSSSVACKKLIINGKSTNGGFIYVGDSTVSSSNGLIVIPTVGQITITPNNLNLIYLDAANSGDGVTYYYEN